MGVLLYHPDFFNTDIVLPFLCSSINTKDKLVMIRIMIKSNVAIDASMCILKLHITSKEVDDE